MQKALLRIGWGGIAFTAGFLFVITAMYFNFRPDVNFLLEKQDVVYNAFWRTSFYIHITGGMLAIIIGPFQFLKSFRRKRMGLHKKLGKAYMASILFIAGPSGLFMAFYAEGGWFSSLGFAVMAFLWLWTTFKAYETIRNRDYNGHIRWITRSFALTMAAVTLRLYVPLTSAVLYWDHDFVITSSAWFSWIPNLIIAELLLRFVPHRL